MRSINIRQINSVSWHRNGVSGMGFYIVLFEDTDHGTMHASLFEEPGYCAVHVVKLIADGNIAFGENSWRGDIYEDALRPMVKAFLKKNCSNKIGPFSVVPTRITGQTQYLS